MFSYGSHPRGKPEAFFIEINTFHFQRKEVRRWLYSVSKRPGITRSCQTIICGDMSLSLKAKGLLSLMLSLPENWDYTMKGLARICKDGIDSISGGIRELEAHGYLIRARVRGANGQLGSIEYTILEQPKAPSPTQEKPIRENPVQANPMLDAPIQEKPRPIK